MSDRRTMLKTGAALSATAWVAPSVLSLDRAAAASASEDCEQPALSNGAVWEDNPPASLAEGGPLDSNTNTFVWHEQGPVELTQALDVDRVTAGNFSGSSNENQQIAAGTWICSYFVHGDRLDDGGTLTGAMTFSNQNIIGLIYRNGTMNASSFLERSGVTYEYGPMEGNDNMSLTLTPGAHALSWSMRFGPHLDQIRVITSCP